MTGQHRRKGFTLMELMIAVAIIGILAATAIPLFSRYQNRSKRSEAMTNLNAIAKLQIAYFGANGIYYEAAPMPGPPLGPNKRIWDAVSQAEFGPLGYQPEGAVVYSYAVTMDPGLCSCPPGGAGLPSCFTAEAHGDLDGDGSVAVIAFFHAGESGGDCATAVGGNPPPVDGSGNPIYDAPIPIPIGGGSDDY
jgi:prepilin-type N-terminal cleavage/methylation domain-containing protein